MNERDFEISGQKFKLNKINAFKQFHIVRRIAPILSELLPAMASISKFMGSETGLSESEKFEQIAAFASPILDGLAKLSDEDSNKVLLGLLEAVEMQQSTGNWARLSNGTQLMFENLELPVMLQCAGRAFAYNMAGFFNALNQVSPGKA